VNARSFWRSARAALLIAASVLAGCSGGGFLPFGQGPHEISQAQLNRILAQQSKEHHVSASLLRAVIHVESGEDPSAISRAGAMGLMQLMPGTARTYGVINPFDPEQNVAGGASHLSALLKQYHGDVALALAAYNAGSGAVAQYKGIPPYAETTSYVNNVLSIFRNAEPRK
jgi:soluble lytic murein transglycosylase-like protein